MGNSQQPHGFPAIQENSFHHQIEENHQHIENNNNNQVITELTCEICIESFSADKSFSNNNKCFHPFCMDCIAKYIQVKVEDNVSDIPCPDLNCKQLLDPLFCRQYISKPVFDKWCHLLCDSAVLLVEQRCYCPNRGCSVLVLNECKPVKKAQCPKCKKYFCFRCQIPWHAGFRCDESEQHKDENDILFGKLLERRGWRRCSKCGQCVEHIGGCRNISCTRCKAIFCYNCGGRPHLGSCESKLHMSPLYAILFIVFMILLLFGVLFFETNWDLPNRKIY